MVEELINGETRFNQPAGHLEAGESLVEAAVRETLEETAWQVSIIGLLDLSVFEAPSGETFLRHTFLALPSCHYPESTLDEGIVAAHWLTREQIKEKQPMLRSSLILPTIDCFQAGNIYPLAMLGHHR